MNYIQLLINEPANATLDLNQEMDIALQYSIADIKDISKRNAAYSKTIVLPGTKNNNYWFGNLFDVNSDFSQFNPNKKTSAKLLVNTETVIDGFLQLRKIVKLNNTDPQGNQINYECVIYNNTVDLMAVIGESPISELDMSQFGHTFSNDAIKESWNNTWSEGYVYPMFGLDLGDNQYKVENFYPSVYYKALLDQMVRQAGFGWTGSLYSNEQFNKEVISYVSDGRPKVDLEEAERRKLLVGRTQSLTLLMGNWKDGNPNNTASATSPYTAYPSNVPVYPGNLGANVRLNDETTAPFFDTSSQFNTTTFEWTVGQNGKYQFDAAIRARLQFKNMNPSFSTFAYWVNPNGSFGLTTSSILEIEAMVQIFNNQTNTWNILWNKGTANVSMPVGIAGNATVFSNPITINFSGDDKILTQGQRVRLAINTKKLPGSTLVYIGTGAGQGIDVSLNILATASTTGNYANFFRVRPQTSEIGQQSFIDFNKFLPDKVKQKDLLSDLIKRYNLFIQTDPENPKRLIFDTRPDFYDRGTIVDWTLKKDYSQQDSIELLSDLQYKLMTWSYKPDKDEKNADYQEITGDVYGQYKYYFDNDFVKGETKIESQFSPSPLVKTAFDAIVPSIDPDLPKVQPRLFLYGGLRDCDNWFWIYQTTGGATGASESFSKYPYAGHFDDPINPEIDLNFGSNKFLFYNDWSYITDNNMYNTYWSDYIRQIETGRLITSFFYLDENDVRFIKDNFYTKIFILDSYYYVNKIIDYKPLNNGTTKVELIKIVDGIRWEPKRSISQIGPKPAQPLTTFNQVVVGPGNTTGGGGVVVVGAGNTVGGKTSKLLPSGLTYSGATKMAVIGDGNSSFGDRSLIVGDGNSSGSDRVAVIAGDNNFIEASNITIINGSGITATESNKIYLGNNYVVDTITGDVLVGGTAVGNLERTLSIGNTSSLQIQLEGFTSSSTTPSYSFQTFTQSGLYHSYQHPFISRVGIAVAGATSALFKNGGVAVQDGAPLQPGYHFINDIDTGLFRNATNELSISCGGATAATFISDGLVLPTGSITNTALRFGTMSAASGFLNNFGNEMMWYSGGSRALWVSGSRVIFNEGNNFSAPPITFGSDLDTGIYRPGANQVGIVAGGATAAVFGQTSITMERQTLFRNNFVLYSPNGTGWLVSITNAGTLTASIVS